MSTPSFTVSHVTSKDDFPDIVAVERKAFGASQLTSLIYSPDPSSPENIANMVHNHQRAWSSDPNAKYLKAETPEGKIIGMAKWYFFLDSTAKDNPWVIEFPPNANEALYDEFFGGLNAARVQKMGAKKHFLMAILVVDPAYQRMGIGHELLRWGLERADEEQVECWIDASRAGHGLYTKFGWEDVGTVEVDLTRWGGVAPGNNISIANMIRQPKAI
jgi:predicted N-acetyltransferase YhbS